VSRGNLLVDLAGVNNLSNRASYPEWSLHQVRVRWIPELAEDANEPVQDVWQTFFISKDKVPGQGVKIGHPDTGYLPHPELDLELEKTSADNAPGGFRKGRTVISDGESAIKPSPDMLPKLPSGFWHGTSTASVIISSEGGPVHHPPKLRDSKLPDKYVTGVAPGAELIAIPIAPLVVDAPRVKIYTPSLAQAIYEAVEKEGVHILSISLGGYPSLAVRRAIINAQKKGVIVAASVGNAVSFTVWPAAYDGVTAVASSTADRKIAAHSAGGSRVDVAAPGEGVWAAVAKFENGKLTYGVEQCSGTSYAAALVAGVAALWLSRWDREYLKECYGGYEKIPLVFDKLLRNTCDPSEEQDPNRRVGIVNAYKLLAAEVDDPRDPTQKIPLDINDPNLQTPPAFGEVDHVALDQGGIATFTHLFEKTLSDPKFIQAVSQKALSNLEFAEAVQLNQLNIVQWILSKLLNQSRKDLRDFLRTFGKELTFHFGTNFNLYKMMENALKLEVNFKQVDSTARLHPQWTLDEVRKELKEKCASEYLQKYLR
jgi:thermitase